MNENRVARNDLLARRIITGLEARNIHGYYAQNQAEVIHIIQELIPQKSSVGWGGSMTLNELGIRDYFREGDFEVYDRENEKDPKKKRELELKIFDCDFMMTSSNAITEEGILVNIDGNSNRVAAIAYGPKHVVFVVGMNKVTKDIDAAIYRARNEAATINAQRFDVDTPCKKSGSCVNCLSPDSICCEFLITRRSMHKDRMHVILVNESLGF